MEKEVVYTVDEMLKRKKRNLNMRALQFLIINLMLKYAGEPDKDVCWMQKHDFEDLKAIDIFTLTKEGNTEFRKVVLPILRKQLGLTKDGAEKELSWFMLSFGFAVECGFENIAKHNEWLCTKVREFEEKHGELHYEDGWENELKIRIGYNK